MQSENSYDGDHGVAQGVAIDDGAFGQAFSAGGANVVLTEFLEIEVRTMRVRMAASAPPMVTAGRMRFANGARIRAAILF